MFSKILIANRGEIACRIMRTCRSMGIKTVAVYSAVDRDALHVRTADEAYLLGDAAPEESYLNSEKILRAAQESGAEAVHPGYGFLSENAGFARDCQEAGVRFIGPTPEIMEQMGDKLQARKLARKAGLAVLPGTDEAVDDSHAAERAWKLGFPLMVKATGGGGGIGIHIVESMDELVPIIERTRQVASHAFGSTKLYFERYLKNASHIEVQIMGDRHGRLVHLFERDCSVQRRNQKLIEETQATKLTPKLRRRVHRLALKLGKKLAYSNAGTVEFLVSTDGQVYFLEMNPRLQVEHGVTELITGLDIVELQIRSAAGEPLTLSQRNIKPRGHAIQVRVYPEDPETFLPAAGVVDSLHLPAGEHVRIDSALFEGYHVEQEYEPLLAKVMAWGQDRDEAISRLLRALLEVRLDGVKCNIPLMRDLLVAKEFAGAAYHTGSLPLWMEERRRAHPHRVVNGPAASSEHDKSAREMAAAIGVAMAVVMGGAQAQHTASPAGSAWLAQGRRDQLLSRTLGNRGW